MPTTGYFSRSVMDYDSEVSNVRVRSAVITAANFDAQATLRTAFQLGMNGIIGGTVVKEDFGNSARNAIVPPADNAIQRELKWLVQFHDAVTYERFSVEIPCADVEMLDPNDRAHAHIGDAGPVDAFVDAFEAFVLTNNGNAALVDEITLVGRRV